MKVLMVAPTPFFADRGCHVRVLEETRALGNLGHEVEIATYHLGASPPGLNVFRTPNVPWYRKLSAGPSWHKPYVDAMLAALVAVRSRRWKPDVIHAHLHEGVAVAAPVARVLRIPLVADLQGSFTDELWSHGFPQRPAPLKNALLWFERAMLRWPACVVTSSAQMARDISDVSPQTAVVVAPDGVDTTQFRPGIEPAEVELPGDGPVIAFLGLLTEYQGVPHLIRSASAVLAREPSARFLVMGYPNVERYRDMADDLGIGKSFTFTGRVPYDLAPNFLALADIAVSPKISKTESNGKLLNYMAMGLPTVAFDTAINRDLLGPHGTYAPFGDAEGLAKAILELIENPADASSRGVSLRRRASHDFSWHRTGEVLVQAYHRSLAP